MRRHHVAMNRLDHALALLHDNARTRPEDLAGMAKFGMDVERRIGVPVPALRKLGRTLGRDHELALGLWDTGIPDAQILAGLVADPARLTSGQMDAWARSIRSWDVCDGACLNAFVHSPLAWEKVAAWTRDAQEFVRRAGFALLATLAVHDRQSDDARFVDALAHIEAAADDARNFVMKAVNWALRGIGKRNAALNAAAIDQALRLQARGTRAARWIAADALRELRSDAVQSRLRPGR
jgi:3-methyladenine DNA glycosylase AlkD